MKSQLRIHYHQWPVHKNYQTVMLRYGSEDMWSDWIDIISFRDIVNGKTSELAENELLRILEESEYWRCVKPITRHTLEDIWEFEV